MTSQKGRGRIVQEQAGVGAFRHGNNHVEARNAKNQNRGQRIVKQRPADGAVLYIEETIRAGQLRIRSVSVLERWRDTGIITSAMFNAAEQFRQDFEAAGLQPHFAISGLERIDCRKGADEVTLLSRAKLKRDSWDSIQRIGRLLGDKGYRAIEAVAGYGITLKEFARRERWSNRPLSEPVARGILFAALEVLAKDFGYE